MDILFIMKNYRKLIKEIERDNRFEIIKTTRKTTIKVKHTESGKLYSVHPGEKAVKPLKHWIKKFK